MAYGQSVFGCDSLIWPPLGFQRRWPTILVQNATRYVSSVCCWQAQIFETFVHKCFSFFNYSRNILPTRLTPPGFSGVYKYEIDAGLTGVVVVVFVFVVFSNILCFFCFVLFCLFVCFFFFISRNNPHKSLHFCDENVSSIWLSAFRKQKYPVEFPLKKKYSKHQVHVPLFISDWSYLLWSLGFSDCSNMSNCGINHKVLTRLMLNFTSPTREDICKTYHG